MSRPAADPLLREAPYVRSLARALVWDRDLAADVEQEVLLAALSNAPRERGALRAWLAVLARNLAHKAWRSSSRRQRREREAARPEALVPSPAEILEREDRRRALVGRVLALDEPLRAVLVLRFLEDLPPREVARRLGVPVETVRSRARRGLELLRARLDREEGGREAWCLAVVAALRVPADATCLCGALASSSLAGVVAMSLAKKVAASAVLLALLAAVALRARRNGAGDVPPRAQPDALVAAPAVVDPAPARAVAATVERANGREALVAPPPASAPLVATSGWLLLRVAWHDGEPAADVAASVTPPGAGEREIEVLDARSGPDGTCRVGPLAPGRVSVSVDRADDYAHAEIAAGAEVELLVTLPRGYDVEGDVTHAGAPVAFAEIWLDRSFVGWGGHRVARADAQGRYRIRSIEEGLAWIGARAPGLAPSPCAELMGGTGATLEVPLEFAQPGGALAGVVLDGAGLPLADAEVLVGDELDRRFVGAGKDAPGAQRIACDANGAFRFEGVEPGLRPVRARAAGHGAWIGEVDVAQGATTTLAITLLPGAIVRGRVTDGAGRPVASADVRCGGGYFADRSRGTAADGSFELRDLPAGEIELVVDAEKRGRASATLHAAPGAELEWNPVVAGLALRGTVVLNGLDPSEVQVRCESDGADVFYLEYAALGAGGEFEFTGLTGSSFRLQAIGGGEHTFPLLDRGGVRPEDGDVVLELDPARWPSIRLQGRVVDADGHGAVGVAIVPVLEGQNVSPLLTTAMDGGFDLGPYPPGRWKLVVRAPGGDLSTETADVALGAVHDFGEIRLP